MPVRMVSPLWHYTSGVAEAHGPGRRRAEGGAVDGVVVVRVVASTAAHGADLCPGTGDSRTPQPRIFA